jgi:nitrogen regulatory protein PII 1
MAVENSDKEKVVRVILQAARTGDTGAFGDGKIFVSPIEDAYTISSGNKGL